MNITNSLEQSKEKLQIITTSNYKFRNGDIGMIINIQSAPHLNGLFATIIRFIKNTQRYRCKFYYNNTWQESSFKAANIKIVYNSKYQRKAKLQQCIVCRSFDAKLECKLCRSIFYCKNACKNKPLQAEGHSYVCGMYKEFAMLQYEPIKEMDELFKFDIFIDSKDWHDWLNKMGLKDVGVWQKACSCCNSTPFGELKLSEKPYKFWGELSQSFIPSFDEPIRSEQIITNWHDWFQFRKLSLKSPVGHFMSYVMSVYYALTRFVKIGPIIKSNDETSETVIIHLVGVELELDILPLFQELLCLLPGYNFDIYCFGNSEEMEAGNIYKTLNGNKSDNCEANRRFKLNDNWIQFNVFSAYYNAQNVEMIEDKDKQIPHMVIGLNAGFELHKQTWMDCVKYICEYDIPAFFTAYANIEIANAERMVLGRIGTHLSHKHIINPFRSPIVEIQECTRLSSIRNGFIYGINLKS